MLHPDRQVPVECVLSQEQYSPSAPPQQKPSSPQKRPHRPAHDEAGGIITPNTLKFAKIMLVDDEPIMMLVIRTFLEDAGYGNIITENDPLRALDVMLKQRPDVLLLDLRMPEKSGFELLGEIRGNAALQYLPVIILTAASDSDTKLQCLEMGATDLLTKPVDPSELVLRLRNALTLKAYQDQLAYNDALTGLPNRQLFLKRLTWTLQLARRHNKQFALLQIGLDRFRQINDTLGHDVGDSALKAIAERLSASLRETDTVCLLPEGEEGAISLSRLAGDEFVVLISELDHVEAASAITSRLLKALEAPLMLNRRELFITMSVGIALYPQDGTQESGLLACADLAMTKAKLQGRNTFCFHSAETNTRQFERLTMETALRSAVERKELTLHYQPKVDLQNGRIVGAEALARWTHAELGPVSPGDFIPLAEETGLILPIGEYILHLACTEAATWQKSGICLPISVNVSNLQFRRGDMPALIKSALQASGLEPGNLIIELTESLLMESAQTNIDMLHAIKQLGVRLSMDDFGTGFSSLSYLKRFPLDELKIDRSFVSELPDDKENAVIVASIINLARGLGIKVVAEGIETPEQLQYLRINGCDQFQGFLFSRPLAGPDFAALLMQQTKP